MLGHIVLASGRTSGL